ncbi:metallophosphoesterase [Gelidibacter gilvus]|uniref:Serine/threonine protein phosphatase n=1 Tax=Gelidibacter gilvus TaxID=59602 RepID=A0A4Q0XGS2_9FLAO|nr:metallophosphoesterase [Gelidibacter gilvus]RXJ49557.1 serine/threonine protein phosphatase [Gelidibacter gilvus]
MRTFIISDIHGKNELFKKALKMVKLKKNDTLILLGDLIDRGNDSKGVLDTIFLLKEHGFKIELVLGNHEKMFLDSYENEDEHTKWMINGGDKTLMSFLTSSIDKIPKKYINLIKSSKVYLEKEGFILVHAGLNMNIENPFEDIETILWERNPKNLLNQDWLGNRVLIHGHTPQTKTEITKQLEENIIGIDNGTYLSTEKGYGSLGILQLETKEIIFVNEN